MKIYALYNPNHLHLIKNISFFSTKEKACSALNAMYKGIKSRGGVHEIKKSETEFSFLFSWEEAQVVWRVVEIELDQEEKC